MTNENLSQVLSKMASRFFPYILNRRLRVNIEGRALPSRARRALLRGRERVSETKFAYTESRQSVLTIDRVSARVEAGKSPIKGSGHEGLRRTQVLPSPSLVSSH